MVASLADVVVAVEVAENLAVDAVHAVTIGLCSGRRRSAWRQECDRSRDDLLMALKLSYWKQSPLQFGRQRAASTLQETSFMTFTTASTAKTGVAARARTVVRAVRAEVNCMMKIESGWFAWLGGCGDC